MRWIPILFFLLAAGCLESTPPENAAAALFHRGAEELAAGREPESLAILQTFYPDSRWNELGLSLRLLAEERNALTKKLRSLEGDAVRCRREIRQKDEEVARVRQDMDRLKQLLIEMERRAR